MFARMMVVATVALTAFSAQPAAAGSFSFGIYDLGIGVSVHSDRGYPRWGYGHRPHWRPYHPRAYYAPPPHFPPPMLSPDGIVHTLQGYGYSQVMIVGRQGPIYLVRAHDPWENVVEVEVWAGDGRIISGRVLEPPVFRSPGPSRGYQPDLAARGVPASPPPARGAVSEGWTAPLPRNRPTTEVHPEEEPLFFRSEEDENGRDPLVVY
jgi:hypothetical protein